MEKLVVPLWRAPEDDPAHLSGWLQEQLLPLLGQPPLRAATLHVESTDPAHARLRHGAGQEQGLLAALVDVWVDSYHDATDLLERLEQAPARFAAYLVCESVPRPYGAARTWPDGERSPGLTLVTTLDKPEGVDEKVFYHYWHELHRATTEQCHPFVCYVRNEVARPLADGAPRLRGIVAESVTDEHDLLDPHRLYRSGGDRERLRATIQRVLDETAAFIDFATIQVAPMQEQIVRSLAPTSP